MSSTPFNFEDHLNELRCLAEKISAEIEAVEPSKKKKRRLALDSVIQCLTKSSEQLDSIRRPRMVFDPTHPDTAGRIVALMLVAQDKHPLVNIPDFYGSGVYAIYYRGDFAPYSRIAARDHPIYVGKADPIVPTAKDPIAQGTKLSDRLKEHAKNIQKATSTLCIEDFDCRFLFVQSGFQQSAERYLINFFKPIWNSETGICFGLGKHGDSSSTRANKRSPWDTIHPGRPWAEGSLGNQKSHSMILKEIEEHFVKYPPYTDIHTLFNHFIDEIKQLDALGN
jgi:hypothetical protein